MRFLFAVCFLILSSVFVFPESTLYGTSGLIAMPPAQSLEYKKMHTAYDYQFQNDNSDDGTSFYKVNVGTYDNLELGFVGGTIPTEGVFVNAKYFVMSDSEAYPTSLAIGLQNMGSKHNSSIYLVASKVFEQGLEGHFGFKATFDEKIDTSAMLGLEYFFSDQVSVLMDYTGLDNLYALNLGARIYLNEFIGVRLYVMDITTAREADEALVSLGLSFSRFF